MFDEVLTQKIIDDFPGASAKIDGTKVTYLDSAATTLKPKVMVDAIEEYYLGVSSNVHRGKSYGLELVSNNFEQARYRVAELLSCSGNEIVMLRNTTEAINLVANGLGLSKSDNVVIFADSHHSNLLPWMERATTHTVRFEEGRMDMGHFHELLKLKPKVVAITHCSNVTGIYHPLEEMVAAAKQNGAIVVVDAAQSVPHRRINVKQLDIDFLTFSAHKMAGPTGMGLLYGKQELLNELRPSLLGGGMVDWVDSESYRLRKIPHRFEAGTPHIAGAYGLRASLEYLNGIGFDKLEQHDTQMSQFMMQQARSRSYLQVINDDPNADRGAVLSFRIPGTPKLDDAARILSDSYGIMCRNGHLCAQPFIDKEAGGQVMRISTYIYNTQKDVEYFFNSLDDLSSLLFQ